MSLKTTTRKPLGLETDLLLAESFDTFKEASEMLLNLGWKHDQAGNENKAYHLYKGVSYFSMLQAFAALMASYQERLIFLGEPCPASKLKEKVACIEAALPCLSKTYKKDFVGIWESLKKTYQLDLDESKCGSCVGIGRMIIEDDDTSIANIVGPCNEQL